MEEQGKKEGKTREEQKNVEKKSERERLSNEERRTFDDEPLKRNPKD